MLYCEIMMITLVSTNTRNFTNISTIITCQLIYFFVASLTYRYQCTCYISLISSHWAKLSNSYLVPESKQMSISTKNFRWCNFFQFWQILQKYWEHWVMGILLNPNWVVVYFKLRLKSQGLKWSKIRTFGLRRIPFRIAKIDNTVWISDPIIKNQVNPVDMGAPCRSSGSMLKMETFGCFAKERVLQDVSHHQHDAHANAYSEAKFLGIVAFGPMPINCESPAFLDISRKDFCILLDPFYIVQNCLLE